MVNTDFKPTTLVPVDFSETSMNAIAYAVSASKVFEDNTITLLHVIEGANFDTVTTSKPEIKESRDVLAIEGAINRFEKIIESYKTENLNFEYAIAGGKPYRKIVEIADENNTNMIVMGTHGSSGIQAFTGSNASKVIQTAHCPVIVVKEATATKEFKNIVLPLDLSKETKQKVNFAAIMAERFNATVHIVSFYETDEFLSNRVNNNLKQVENYLKDRNIKTTTTLLKDMDANFAMSTLAWAEEQKADLIIIMTKQERDVSEYIFGTYAQQIVNRSNVPVMTIRPNPELEGVMSGSLGTNSASY